MTSTQVQQLQYLKWCETSSKGMQPFTRPSSTKNILTGEVVNNVQVDKSLCCTKEDGVACAKSVDKRLRNKSSSIHSTISKIKLMSPKTALNLDSKADIKSETIKALMFIEYG